MQTSEIIKKASELQALASLTPKPRTLETHGKITGGVLGGLLGLNVGVIPGLLMAKAHPLLGLAGLLGTGAYGGKLGVDVGGALGRKLEIPD